MAAVLPNESLARLLSYWIGQTANVIVPWSLMLYTNDIELGPATVLADLTEATFDGYTRKTLAPASWTAPAVVADEAVSTYTTDPLTWTVGDDSGTIHGYAVIDATAGKIIGAESIDPPIEYTPAGVIGVLPRMVMRGIPCE